MFLGSGVAGLTAGGVPRLGFFRLRRGRLGERFLCCFRRLVRGGEEVLPRVLSGPGFWQMKDHSSGAGGDPARNVDDLGSDCPGPGLREHAGSKNYCGAGQVVGYDRGDQPG